MSTRSATNKRNTNPSGTGVARKSAASAKPARQAAGSVRVVSNTSKGRRQEREKTESYEGLSKEEKKARKAERRKQEDKVYAASDALMKADPLYDKYHKVWWVALAVAIVSLVVMWMVASLVTDTSIISIIEVICLILAYGSIIAAFIFDMVKIRPIRNQYQNIANGMSDAKLGAVIEHAAAEDDAKQAAKEAAKEARRAARKWPWSKKKQ